MNATAAQALADAFLEGRDIAHALGPEPHHDLVRQLSDLQLRRCEGWLSVTSEQRPETRVVLALVSEELGRRAGLDEARTEVINLSLDVQDPMFRAALQQLMRDLTGRRGGPKP